MDTMSNSGEQSRKNSPKKFRVLKWILILAAAFLVLLILVLPMYLSSSSGTGLIVNTVNDSIDGTIGMSDFSLGWIKGVRLKDLTFEDDKTTVNVKEITAKPHYSSLLTGRISFDEVVVDTPEVSLDVKLDEMNTPQTSATPSQPGKTDAKKSTPALPIGQIDLTVKNGNVKINGIDKSRQKQTIHFKNIASKVDIKPAGEKSTFDVALDVESPDRRSKVTADGSIKTSEKWTLAGTSGDINLKVKDLNLASLRPVFALMDKQVDVSGTLNIDAQAKIDDGDVEKLTVDSVLTGFSQTIDGRQIVFDQPLTLKADTSAKGDKVTVEKAELKSSFCNITARGTTDQLEYVADADLAETMGFVSTFVDLGGYRFAGLCHEEGRIIFDDGKIRFADHSSIENFVISKNGKPDTPLTSAKFTFDMTLDVDNSSVKVDRLTMDTVTPLANIAVTDTVFSWAKDAREKIDLKLKADVVLANAMPFAKFFEAVPDKMQLDGSLKTQLAVQSNKSSLRVNTEKTSITNLKFATTGVEETFEDDLVKIKFDMTTEADSKTISFDIDSSKIDAQGTIDQTEDRSDMAKLKGDVTAKYDLADVSTIASAYLPEGLQMQGKRSDEIRFESKYPKDAPDQRMANMDASANFGFDSAKYMGMNIGSADIDIKVKDGMLDIAPFSTSVNNGKLNFAGSIDLNAKPAIFKTPGPIKIIDKINVNDEMGRMLLKYLNPVFAGQADLSGIANLQCDKLSLPLGGDAAISNAEIMATIAISEMNLKSKGLMGQIMSHAHTGSSLAADMLPTDFILQNGIMGYEDMQINIDKRYPLNFKGSVDLNTPDAKLNMSVKPPYVIVLDGFEPKFKTVQINQPSADRIKLTIGGTVDNPKFDFAEVIKDNVEQFIQKGIEGYLKKDSRKKSKDSQPSPEEEILKGIFDALK